MVGNAKLIGGDISHNIDDEMVFNFVAKKGTFSYNEAIHKFKTKLEIRWNMVAGPKGEGERRELLPERVTSVIFGKHVYYNR